jgi:hypothetical protein
MILFFVPESHEPVIHVDDETQGEIPEEDNNTITYYIPCG